MQSWGLGIIRDRPVFYVYRSGYPFYGYLVQSHTMEDMEKTGSGARQALLDKYKDGMKLVSTHIGEVTLSK